MKATRDTKTCFIGGDYDLDVLHYNDHSKTQNFVDTLFSYVLFPLKTKSIRIATNSATLIDIFTNCLTKSVVNGIIINDISDHLPNIVYILDPGDMPKEKTKIAYNREYNEINSSPFLM